MNLKHKLILATAIASAIALSMITFTAKALGLNQEYGDNITDAGFTPDAGKFDRKYSSYHSATDMR